MVALRTSVTSVYVGTAPVELLEWNDGRHNAVIMDDIHGTDGIQIASSRNDLPGSSTVDLRGEALELHGPCRLWAQRPSGSTELVPVLVVESRNSGY